MSSHRAIPACTVPRAPNTTGLSMLPTDVAIDRTADVNEQAGVSLLVSETGVRSVGFDLPCSGDGRIPRCHPSPQAYQVDADTTCTPLEPENADKCSSG